jgi:hypothetical protein
MPACGPDAAVDLDRNTGRRDGEVEAPEPDRVKLEFRNGVRVLFAEAGEDGLFDEVFH